MQVNSRPPQRTLFIKFCSLATIPVMAPKTTCSQSNSSALATTKRTTPRCSSLQILPATNNTRTGPLTTQQSTYQKASGKTLPPKTATTTYHHCTRRTTRCEQTKRSSSTWKTRGSGDPCRSTSNSSMSSTTPTKRISHLSRTGVTRTASRSMLVWSKVLKMAIRVRSRDRSIKEMKWTWRRSMFRELTRTFHPLVSWITHSRL